MHTFSHHAVRTYDHECFTGGTAFRDDPDRRAIGIVTFAALFIGKPDRNIEFTIENGCP